jgi:hypothetical protein
MLVSCGGGTDGARDFASFDAGSGPAAMREMATATIAFVGRSLEMELRDWTVRR